jgi:hypothetical protein
VCLRAGDLSPAGLLKFLLRTKCHLIFSDNFKKNTAIHDLAPLFSRETPPPPTRRGQVPLTPTLSFLLQLSQQPFAGQQIHR